MNFVLIQLQLSSYDKNGTYILETDSNFQCNVSRVREWLKHNPNLRVDILVPIDEQTLTSPESLTEGIPGFERVSFVRHLLPNHAIKTRYHFDMNHMEAVLHEQQQFMQYTHVFINDPMLLRHFQALFFTCFKTKPKFIVQNHFVDDLVTPKFPSEVSMWHGQVEAALRSDINVFYTKHLLHDMTRSMKEHYNYRAIEEVVNKTKIWKACYSTDEINKPVDLQALRFDPSHPALVGDKVVVLVPNRVGGMGRSSDYTNAGHFLFEVANKAFATRQDFVVIAGNPNQKFSNDELAGLCKPLVNLVPDTFRRNEFRYVGSKADINVGLYNYDVHGGTAWRECIDLGCLPLSNDMHEYKHFFDKVEGSLSAGYPFRVKNDLSNCLEVFHKLLDHAKARKSAGKSVGDDFDFGLRQAVVEECSYEGSGAQGMRDIGLL